MSSSGSDDDSNIFARHQEKMFAIEQARAQIGKLQQALQRDPDNTAIQKALDDATEMSEPVEYLCTAIGLLNDHQNATSDLERMSLEKRYFEEALHEQVPDSFHAKWQQYLGTSPPPAETSNAGIAKAKREAYNCKHCKATNSLIYDTAEGNSTCGECGHVFQDNLTSEVDDLPYNQRMERNTSLKLCPRSSKMAALSKADKTAANKYKYESRTYLAERIAQVQAKETIRISKEDMLAIQKGLVKYRIESIDDWTPLEMKNFLGKIRLSKLYKHQNYILSWLSKKPPVIIPKDVEDVLIRAFDTMAPVVTKYKGLLSDHRCTERKSRPHYGYICRQLLKLVGYEKYAYLFPQLISLEKLALYDDFWKRLCAELGWKAHLSER